MTSTSSRRRIFFPVRVTTCRRRSASRTPYEKAASARVPRRRKNERMTRIPLVAAIMFQLLKLQAGIHMETLGERRIDRTLDKASPHREELEGPAAQARSQPPGRGAEFSHAGLFGRRAAGSGARVVDMKDFFLAVAICSWQADVSSVSWAFRQRRIRPLSLRNIRAKFLNIRLAGVFFTCTHPLPGLRPGSRDRPSKEFTSCSFRHGVIEWLSSRSGHNFSASCRQAEAPA